MDRAVPCAQDSLSLALLICTVHVSLVLLVSGSSVVQLPLNYICPLSGGGGALWVRSTDTLLLGGTVTGDAHVGLHSDGGGVQTLPTGIRLLPE